MDKMFPKVEKSVHRQDFIVLVLLSTHAKRFGVPRMQDFFSRSSSVSQPFSLANSGHMITSQASHWSSAPLNKIECIHTTAFV